MALSEEKVRTIVSLAALQFSGFGGGKVTSGNVVSHALQDRPPVFAAGVDVEEVVRFVLSQADSDSLVPIPTSP